MKTGKNRHKTGEPVTSGGNQKNLQSEKKEVTRTVNDRNQGSQSFLHASSNLSLTSVMEGEKIAQENYQKNHNEFTGSRCRSPKTHSLMQNSYIKKKLPKTTIKAPTSKQDHLKKRRGSLFTLKKDSTHSSILRSRSTPHHKETLQQQRHQRD